MSKLYYDDSRINSLMREWHGVKTDGNSTFEQYEPSDQWAIRPESLDVFKPQVGDLVEMDVFGVFRIEKQDKRVVVNDGDLEIIQRQGKPFFNPGGS